VRLITLPHLLALANETIREEQLRKLQGIFHNPEQRPPWPGAMPLRKLDNHKHVLQSAKKLYGCLAAHPKTRWCFVTDSETLLIRCIKLADVIEQWASRRTILHNPAFKPPLVRPSSPRAVKRLYHQYGLWLCPRRVDAMLLGQDAPSTIGWMMESYTWFWERDVVKSFYQHLRDRNATPAQLWDRGAFGEDLRPNETGKEPFVAGFPDGVACRTRLFIEQTLYTYIALSHASLPHPYTFVSTAAMAAAVSLPTSVVTAGVDHGTCSVGECLTALVPQMNLSQAVLAGRFLWEHKIPTISPRPERNATCRYCFPAPRRLTPTEVAFLDASRVSFMTSGGLRDGPFGDYARSLNARRAPTKVHAASSTISSVMLQHEAYNYGISPHQPAPPPPCFGTTADLLGYTLSSARSEAGHAPA
jgi:hypothetical protein